MPLKVFVSVIFFVFITGCYHSERQCTDFKTGTFEFTYIVDGIKKTGTFTRTEDLNIDYFDNKVDSASVRWINDCEFIQKALHPKSALEEKAIHFKIISTTEDSYTFEYKLAVKEPYKKNRVEKGIAKKIK